MSRAPLSYLARCIRMPPAIRVVPVPLFTDNYAYLIANDAHRACVLVDAADAPRALAAVPPGLELVGVLTTHHHGDHAGGNAQLAALRPGLEVVGGDAEEGRVPAATRLVRDGELLELGGVSITALHTPFHTRGHTCFLVASGDGTPGALFTGDALFGGGCGRFFEGDAPTAAASLAKLAALPPATAVHCGHEYTVANLRFCAAVEPRNAATAARLAAAVAARARGAPTGPSTLGDELATNVFLRCHVAAVRDFTHPGWDGDGRGEAPPTPVDVLARLREAKNAFRA